MTPSAEIICVGTELLLGDILNGNAQFLAQQLAALGIPHYYQTVVGDNPQRLQRAIATACQRSRILLFTGGLGPTPDDLTTETIAQFFDVPLVEHPAVIADIEQKFAQRGRTMVPSNRKQALLPAGAAILTNRVGTAPGMIWQPVPELLLMTFPGVPSEMRTMWAEVAVPYLRDHGWSRQTIVSQTLKFWGISESALAERVADYLASSDPTVAPYANRGSVKLRVSACGATAAEALAKIEPMVAQIRDRVGPDCYGLDQDTLPIVVGRSLQDRGETLAVAESCTGGGLGQLLTAVAGSSAYFLGGIIAYDNRIKTALLGVSAETLDRFGAVSHETAKEMAIGARDRLGSTWAISITGVAGPGGGSEAKPVGLVYAGIAGPDGVTTHEMRLGIQRDREWIRYVSACTALDFLRRRWL